MKTLTEIQLEQKVARLQLQQRHIEEMKALKESQEKDLKEFREKINHE